MVNNWTQTNMKEIRALKKVVLLTLAIVAMFGTAHAFHFSAVVPSGQTLFFDTVIGGEASVTYPKFGSNSYTYSYYWNYPVPEGNLVIPDSIIYDNRVYKIIAIGNAAFYNCDRLTSVTIPKTIVSIGNNAFHGCIGLSTVDFNAINCTFAGLDDYNRAFYGCNNISTVNIGNDVTIIPAYLFYGCSGLTSIIIPNSVISIGDNAFSGSGLSAPVYNNNLFAYMPTSFSGGYTIPDGITSICGGAFRDCNRLSSITIPNSIISIGDYAFSGCSGLPSINLPNSVTSIGGGAFQGCDQLSSIIIPSPVSRIENETFSGCLRLMSVSLSENITKIGYNAFYNCGIIGELVIPQSVTEIGDWGFGGCYGITEITCLGRVAPMLGYRAFEGVDSNITVNIPCGSANLYAGRWPQFHEFNGIPFLFNAISENINRGTVTVEQEPTCDNPYAVIRATPRAGYHFDHWSDGSTDNPYSYTATGSVTLIGYFVGDVGLEEADGNTIKVLVSEGRITVESSEEKQVRVYDVMGRVVATTTTGKTVAVPRNGVYLVKVGDAAAKKIVVL